MESVKVTYWGCIVQKSDPKNQLLARLTENVENAIL